MPRVPRQGLLTAASLATAYLSVVCSVTGATGCGPSVQVLHEGTVRFEHCYRLDLDPKIAPSHRKACWRAWSERHSYGQPRDRLEYAKRRIQAIESNEPAPGLDLDVGSPRSSLVEPGGPIDAHAPPPRVARPTRSMPISDSGVASDAPGDGCSTTCRQHRTTCLAACAEGAPDLCPCEADYRACMVRCFE